VAGSCEYGNEPSGYIKDGDVLTSWMADVFSRSILLSFVSWLVGWLVA